MQLDVGSELRRVRESRKLSLRTVASAVGVSASLLSQVETGKTQPSVSTLYALVTYLGISLDGLWATTRVEPIPGVGLSLDVGEPEASEQRRSDSVVQRRADNPVIEMENGVTWERMAVGESSVADPLIVTYQPAGSSSIEGKMMRHAGLEYGVHPRGAAHAAPRLRDLRPRARRLVVLRLELARTSTSTSRTSRRAGIWFVIGRRDMGYQSLADLGHEDPGETRPIASAVDVLQAMKSIRPGGEA